MKSIKDQVTSQRPSQQQNQKIYIICLNPNCCKPKQRCMTSLSLHTHPSECSNYFYPADQIINKNWMLLDKYPNDNLGIAAKKKIQISENQNFLILTIQNLKEKIENSLKELQNKIVELYPDKQLFKCYNEVYNLQKISSSLKSNKNPTYISQLINSNYSTHKQQALFRLNESLDEIKNTIDSLNNKVLNHFDTLLNKHRSYQIIKPSKNIHFKKINFGVYKSKFIASSKIQFEGAIVKFPKILNVASFLPWIYTDKHFNEGIHEFKISSLRYPIVLNSGFTVLEQHDIDTYPYSTFKSLFNREGKGFKLLNGEEIDTFVAQTTVVILRLELGQTPIAIIHDSEMKCYYQCELKRKTTYRMGVYGCGWAMEAIQLN